MLVMGKLGVKAFIGILILNFSLFLVCVGGGYGADLAWMNVTTVGGGVPAAAPAYTEEFFYNADHATNTETAYTVNRTSSIAGSEGSTITQPVGATDPGTASSDGGNVIKLNASGAHIEFAVTAGDIVGSAAGLVSFEYYAGSSGTNEVITIYAGSWNKIEIKTLANNTIYFKYNGDDTECIKTSTATFTDNTWTTLQFRWSIASGACGVKVGSNDWENTTGQTLRVMTSEPTMVYIGNDGWNGIADTPMYLDAIKIWKTYDGS